MASIAVSPMMLLKRFRPNAVSASYALFLAVNATVIWGGVFPFLPADFQTRSVIVSFFLAQSIAFALCLLGNALAAAFGAPRWVRALLSKPAAPYIAGWLALIGATYLPSFAFPLVLAAGILIGFNTAGFFIQWNEVFAAERSRRGSQDLMLGTVMAPLIYAALYVIPIAMTTFLIPLVFTPLFMLGLRLKRDSVTAAAPAPIPENSETRATKLARCRSVARDCWRGALCIGTIGFASGVVRSIAISTPHSGEVVNLASMGGVFVAALGLFLIWQLKPLRINVTSIFRASFPFVATAFALLPLFGEGYLMAFAGVVYAIYGCSILLTMLQSEQIAASRFVSPTFVYGFFGCTVYAMHDFGFVCGQFSALLTMPGANTITTTAFAAIYVLGLAMFISQGGLRTAISPGHLYLERIEPMMTAALPQTRNRESDPAPTSHADGVRDRISKQCQLVTKHYALSARESEIMELFARGHTAKSIAQQLLLTENTVNTHARRLYAKVGVHKRQELILLVDGFAVDQLQ